jgi:hypothetical protein
VAGIGAGHDGKRAPRLAHFTRMGLGPFCRQSYFQVTIASLLRPINKNAGREWPRTALCEERTMQYHRDPLLRIIVIIDVRVKIRIVRK